MDGYIQLGQGEELEFYQVEERSEQFSQVDPDDLEIIAVFLRIDKQFNIYERR